MSLERAAAMALLTIERLRLDTFPIDAFSLVQRCRNTKVMTWQEYCDLPAVKKRFPDAVYSPHPEAVTERFVTPRGDRWLVCYDPRRIHFWRLNFSMAHELGHIVLKHTGTGPAEEAEANLFAQHLLVPRPAVAQLISCESQFGIESLHRFFGVSKACLRVIQRSHRICTSPEQNARVRAIFSKIQPLEHDGSEAINFRFYMYGYTEEL